MSKFFAAALAMAAAASLPQTAAYAATTVDVSTGQAGALPGRDANWIVTGPGVMGGPIQAYIPTEINSAWVGGPTNSGTASKWITPNANGNANLATGPYTYSTVFTLPDLTQLTQLVLSGRFWADNQVFSILLNGATIYAQDNINVNAEEFRPANFTIFSSPVGFAGFVEGPNTLVFNMFNGTGGLNPTGLNVETQFSAVPEPGTWLLMLLGFGAIGFVMRSRKIRGPQLSAA